jgi:dihydrofolate reductase
LIRAALDQRLIDEITVTIIPTVLGQGKPLFAGVGQRHSFMLVSSREIGAGFVQICYVPRTNA